MSRACAPRLLGEGVVRLLGLGRPWGCVYAEFARVSPLAVRRKICRPSLCVLDALRLRGLAAYSAELGSGLLGPEEPRARACRPPFPKRSG